jgi:hypothetical protein
MGLRFCDVSGRPSSIIPKRSISARLFAGQDSALKMDITQPN